MDYKDFGLVNTREMFASALAHHYAIPAFNFYNMETLAAIISAARDTHSPVILAVSESALKYMGDDLLRGMIWGLNLKKNDNVALHLDHGSSLESCARAIKLGFSSVMIDGSKLPFDANIELARTVADLAHKYDVTTEAELGTVGKARRRVPIHAGGVNRGLEFARPGLVLCYYALAVARTVTGDVLQRRPD